MLAGAPERAATHAGDIIVVFNDNDPARMLPLIFRTQPVNESRIGSAKARPKPEIRGFRRKPFERLNDPLPIIRKQWAQDYRELVAKVKSIVV